MDEHRQRLPSGRDRHAFEGQDDEPEHQHRGNRAEQEGGDVVHRTFGEPALHTSEDEAPDATPEREGPDLRYAKWLGWIVTERRVRGHAQRIHDGPGGHLEDERRDEPRRKTT